MNELAETGLLRAYVAVVEAESFTDAAVKLGLTRSAIGKAITRLEDQLGVRLLHRTTRRVGLTADGQNFYERANQILQDLHEAQESVRGGRLRPHGTLRLTAPEAFGRQVVLPILAEYLQQWPELTAEANFSDRLVDVVEEGFDLAIRFGASSVTSDLVARVITRQIGYLAASPEYLARHGTPTGPEELAQHKQLVSGTRMRLHAWVLTKGDDALFTVPMRPTLVMDSAGALLDAARSGMGIICLPNFLTNEDLRAGRLVPVLPNYRTQEMPISVVFPSRRHLSAKVRLFIELLSKRVS